MPNIVLFTLDNVFQILLFSIPVGFLIGSFPMLIGLGLSGIVNIFKKA